MNRTPFASWSDTRGECTLCRRQILRIAAGTVYGALGAVLLWPTPAWAQPPENHDTYQFVAGIVPIVAGPDTAIAPSGSTVTLTGSGMFKAGPDKTASGGGNYTIKDSTGSTVASGIWTVTGILEFVDYGPAIPQGLPASLHGGMAKLRVSLAGFDDGVLTITCLLGTPPPSKMEGITLVLGQGGNFNTSTGGETVFIKQ
jgi:hypothetical protein